MPDGKSTEGTVRKEEQPSPLNIGKNGALILVSILLLAASLFVIFGGESADTANPGMDETLNPDPAGPEAGTGVNASEETDTAIEDKTVDPVKSEDEIEAGTTNSANSELLKKIGPLDLLPYGEKVDGTIWNGKEAATFAAQSESFSLDDGSICGVGITSTRDPGISFSGFSTKKMIVLMILRDDSGNCILQSKIDETTGNPYFMRMIVDTNPTTPLYKEDQVKISVEEKRKAQTWEVLVYSY